MPKAQVGNLTPVDCAVESTAADLPLADDGMSLIDGQSGIALQFVHPFSFRNFAHRVNSQCNAESSGSQQRIYTA